MEERDFFITGIQQVGVGTTSVYDSWKWFIKMFGVDIRVLEDDTVAERMLPYTGGHPRKRHAAIAVNLQGGGGFEIWQYSQRKPKPVDFQIQVGDLFGSTVCGRLPVFAIQRSTRFDRISHAKVGQIELL